MCNCGNKRQSLVSNTQRRDEQASQNEPKETTPGNQAGAIEVYANTGRQRTFFNSVNRSAVRNFLRR